MLTMAGNISSMDIMLNMTNTAACKQKVLYCTILKKLTQLEYLEKTRSITTDQKHLAHTEMEKLELKYST